MHTSYDVIVIGAGVIGAATATEQWTTQALWIVQRMPSLDIPNRIIG